MAVKLGGAGRKIRSAGRKTHCGIIIIFYPIALENPKKYGQ